MHSRERLRYSATGPRRGELWRAWKSNAEYIYSMRMTYSYATRSVWCYIYPYRLPLSCGAFGLLRHSVSLFPLSFSNYNVSFSRDHWVDCVIGLPSEVVKARF